MMTYNDVVTDTVSGMADETPLARELRSFDAHRAELVGTALGKFVLIKDDDVIGTYETERDAIAEGYRRFGNVPFLVKAVAPVDMPEHFVSNLLAI